jgi:hypothetical protein
MVRGIVSGHRDAMMTRVYFSHRVVHVGIKAFFSGWVKLYGVAIVEGPGGRP